MTYRANRRSATAVRQLYPLTFLKDYLGPKGYWTFRSSYLEIRIFASLLLILGALGTGKLIQSDKRHLGITLASALAILFVITYFGALMPFTSSWQPLRFKVRTISFS